MSEPTEFETMDYDVVRRKVIDLAMTDRWEAIGAWFFQKCASKKQMLDTCRGIHGQYECGYEPSRLLKGYIYR